MRTKSSWKTVCSMILVNNSTKWICSQLFGCARAKLGPLGRGQLHHLIIYHWIITSLTCRYMDPLLTLYSLLCVTKWQKWGKIFKELAKKWGSFWNNIDVSVLFSHHLNWNLLAFLLELFHFDSECNSWKQIIKIRLLRISKF